MLGSLKKMSNGSKVGARVLQNENYHSYVHNHSKNWLVTGDGFKSGPTLELIP